MPTYPNGLRRGKRRLCGREHLESIDRLNSPEHVKPAGLLSERASYLIDRTLSAPTGRYVLVIDKGHDDASAWRAALCEISRSGAPVWSYPLYWPVEADPANDTARAGRGITMYELRAQGHAAKTYRHLSHKSAAIGEGRWADLLLAPSPIRDQGHA